MASPQELEPVPKNTGSALNVCVLHIHICVLAETDCCVCGYAFADIFGPDISTSNDFFRILWRFCTSKLHLINTITIKSKVPSNRMSSDVFPLIFE